MTLFRGFKEDPLMRKLFRDLTCLYSFFELLVSLARLGVLRVTCVEERGVVASAALLSARHVRLRITLRIIAAVKLLAILARCLDLRGVLRFIRSLAWLPRYMHYLLQIEKPCHLFFIASLLPGRGYGSKLLKDVEEECRRLGGRSVMLEVDLENRALTFYARRGYRPLALTRFADRDFLLMEKPLNL